MVLHGGPLDGTTMAPVEGFPAPDAYGHRDWPDENRYYRFYTDDTGYHHYRWVEATK